jgi:hypothetical protein
MLDTPATLWRASGVVESKIVAPHPPWPGRTEETPCSLES